MIDVKVERLSLCQSDFTGIIKLPVTQVTNITVVYDIIKPENVLFMLKLNDAVFIYKVLIDSWDKTNEITGEISLELQKSNFSKYHIEVSMSKITGKSMVLALMNNNTLEVKKDDESIQVQLKLLHLSEKLKLLEIRCICEFPSSTTFIYFVSDYDRTHREVKIEEDMFDISNLSIATSGKKHVHITTKTNTKVLKMLVETSILDHGGHISVKMMSPYGSWSLFDVSIEYFLYASRKVLKVTIFNGSERLSVFGEVYFPEALIRGSFSTSFSNSSAFVFSRNIEFDKADTFKKILFDKRSINNIVTMEFEIHRSDPKFSSEFHLVPYETHFRIYCDIVDKHKQFYTKLIMMKQIWENKLSFRISRVGFLTYFLHSPSLNYFMKIKSDFFSETKSLSVKLLQNGARTDATAAYRRSHQGINLKGSINNDNFDIFYDNDKRIIVSGSSNHNQFRIIGFLDLQNPYQYGNIKLLCMIPLSGWTWSEIRTNYQFINKHELSFHTLIRGSTNGYEVFGNAKISSGEITGAIQTSLKDFQEILFFSKLHTSSYEKDALVSIEISKIPYMIHCRTYARKDSHSFLFQSNMPSHQLFLSEEYEIEDERRKFATKMMLDGKLIHETGVEMIMGREKASLELHHLLEGSVALRATFNSLLSDSRKSHVSFAYNEDMKELTVNLAASKNSAFILIRPILPEMTLDRCYMTNSYMAVYPNYGYSKLIEPVMNNSKSIIGIALEQSHYDTYSSSYKLGEVYLSDSDTVRLPEG